MHRLSLFALGSALTLALLGCHPSTETADNPTPPPPPPAPLTDDLRQLALERGRAIASETFGLLSSNLLAAIQSGGVSNALPFCSLAASPLTAGMASKHGVTLRRVTHKPRHPTARANATELAVIQSFQSALTASASVYNASNPPPPLVTNLGPGRAAFFAPIILNRELCLKCHGEPGKDIQTTDLDVIRRLYPADEATGFRLGDLRGAWRIDFPASP